MRPIFKIGLLNLIIRIIFYYHQSVVIIASALLGPFMLLARSITTRPISVACGTDWWPLAWARTKLITPAAGYTDILLLYQ